MITPAEADSIIMEGIRPLPAEDCPLVQAHGRVLREGVLAERDLPPYDRVMLDGIALRAANLEQGLRRFRVVGLQSAGMVPLAIREPGECVEVMTGASLPAGADCIIPYEDCTVQEAEATVPGAVRAHAGQGIHRKGSDFRAGATLLESGRRLTGREIAVAASCGRAMLKVSLQPNIAIVATGDELVEVDAPIAAHQIRRSNDYALRAALAGAGFLRADRYHLRDMQHEIEAALPKIITEYDAVLLCGGVSKGKYDLLPTVLEQLRVVRKFHGVRQRPGKPFWFGITPRQTPVFALPGNPVSAFTCFHRYALPALLRMVLAHPARPERARLAAAFTFKPALTCFLPVRLESSPEGVLGAFPAPANTSGDFASLAGSDGFLELPENREVFPEGFVAPLYRWVG